MLDTIVILLFGVIIGSALSGWLAFVWLKQDPGRIGFVLSNLLRGAAEACDCRMITMADIDGSLHTVKVEVLARAIESRMTLCIERLSERNPNEKNEIK